MSNVRRIPCLVPADAERDSERDKLSSTKLLVLLLSTDPIVVLLLFTDPIVVLLTLLTITTLFSVNVSQL